MFSAGMQVKCVLHKSTDIYNSNTAICTKWSLKIKVKWKQKLDDYVLHNVEKL